MSFKINWLKFLINKPHFCIELIIHNLLIFKTRNDDNEEDYDPGFRSVFVFSL